MGIFLLNQLCFRGGAKPHFVHSRQGQGHGQGQGQGQRQGLALSEFQQTCLTTTSRGPNRAATGRLSVSKRQLFDLASIFHICYENILRIILRLVEGMKVKRDSDPPLLCPDALVGIPINTVVVSLIIHIST